jgi:hypothetical protein
VAQHLEDRTVRVAGDEATYAGLHVVELDRHNADSTGADSWWRNRLRRTPGRTGSARLTIQPRSITGSKPTTRRYNSWLAAGARLSRSPMMHRTLTRSIAVLLSVVVIAV